MVQINPCTLSWNDLSGNAKSKYCSECSKSIQDLTGLSDNAIIDLYNNQNGKLCGKISYSQLDYINPYSPLKRFVFALIIVFGTSLFSLSVQAQDSIKSIKQELQPLVENNLTTISGDLLDDNNEPLPFCNIWFEDGNKKISTYSDFNGNYKLNLYWGEKQTIELFYKFIGYDTRSVIIHRTEVSNIILESVVLKESGDQCTLGILIIEQPNFSKEPDDLRKTTFRRSDIERHPKK